MSASGRDSLDELDDDIRDHILRETEENIARGMAPDEAAAAATRAFGSIALAKEDVRAVWVPVWTDRLRQDVRYAIRSARRAPGFTLVAVLTLALVVGANTAIFSLLYGVLLRPLPLPNAQRLVRLSEFHAGATPTLRDPVLTSLTYEAWRRSPRALDQIAAYSERAYDVTGNGDPEHVSAASFSPELFQLFDLTPAAGRFFEPHEALRGADHVVVLGYGYWRQRFGGRPDVLGGTITLDAQPYVIIGVAPAGFSFPDQDRRLYTPLVVNNAPPGTTTPYVSVLSVIGRLAPGAAPEQAEAEGNGVLRGMGPPPVPVDLFFGHGGTPTVRVRRLIDDVTAPVRPMLLLLGAGVVLVLLVGCANVANLFLFRGVARERELAIRSAIGAGRGRVVQQLLTESLVVAAAGGLAGTLLAWSFVRLWPTLAPAAFPRLHEVRLDWAALAFAASVTLVSALLAGVAPAVLSAPAGPVAALRESPGASRRAVGSVLRRALPAIETAFAVLLLVGSALLLRSFVRLLETDTGFDASNILTARVSLQGDAVRTRWQPLASEIVERVRAVPGVVSAGAASMAPFGDSTFIFGFRLKNSRGEPIIARAIGYVVTPGFAETLHLRLRRGRLLTPSDVGSGTEAMLVNEQFVKMYLDDGRPVVGRKYEGLLGPKLTAEIVGVVGNVLRHGFHDAPQPEFYVTVGHEGLATGREIYVVARTAGDPAALAAPLRSVVRDVDPQLPVHHAGPLAAELAATAGDARFAMLMLAAFAGLALSLAAVGLYGVLSYSVSRRRREFGVRSALGARRRDVVAMVLVEGMGVTGAGLIAGLVIAAGSARLMRAVVFGVDTLDAVSFSMAAALLVVVASAACMIPAWRASAVDPASALRSE